MALQDALGGFDSESNDAVQATHFKIENPDHPESSDVDDPELAGEYFRAARFLQDSIGSQRNELVGRFARAIYENEVNDNEEPIKELFEELIN